MSEMPSADLLVWMAHMSMILERVCEMSASSLEKKLVGRAVD